MCIKVYSEGQHGHQKCFRERKRKRFDCTGDLKHIIKAFKNFPDFQVPQKIEKLHSILNSGFFLRALAELASSKNTKENTDSKIRVSKVHVAL